MTELLKQSRIRPTKGLTLTPWVPLPVGIELHVGVSEMETTVPFRVTQSKHRFAYSVKKQLVGNRQYFKYMKSNVQTNLAGAVQRKIVLSKLTLKHFPRIIDHFI